MKKKYLWIGFALTFVVVLVIAGMIILPEILNKPVDDSEDYIMTPGHWWKAQLNDDQIEIIRQIWGSDISCQQFVAQICPELLQGIPPEEIANWDKLEMYWTRDRWEEFNSTIACIYTGRGITTDGQTHYYQFYLGFPTQEQDTLKHTEGYITLTDENSFRISFYLDKIIGKGGETSH